jgi:DNA-binding LacI/PurR family transcriptional regulator
MSSKKNSETAKKAASAGGQRKAAKRVTLKDISAAAQVSIRTVSLALNNQGRISQATRKKITKIAQKLDYRPSILARSLVSNKSYLFGVNSPYLDLSFINTIIAGMEQKCIELRYELLITTMGISDISFFGYDIETLKNSLERLVFRQVDGIACFPEGGALKHYQRVVDQGIPLIQLLRPLPALACPSITVDNEQGMYLAVKYLADSGRARIGFLKHHDSGFIEAHDRLRGYARALEESGLKLDRDRFSAACDLGFRGGYDAARQLLKRRLRLDAIAAATDYAAAGAVRACLDLGKKVPEEISIIGYDDMDFTELQGYKSLSTVRQPKRKIGALAAEMLYRMSQGETADSVVLQPELVLRESTA